MQETREIRALAIAATTQLRPGPDGWRVPSQSGGGAYRVDPDAGWCSCPDHETRAIECKHILAVRLTLRRERGVSGAYRYTREVQVTYSQQWSAYNAAQTEEKGRFLELLSDLTRAVATPRPAGRGRPALPVGDMTFACVYKVYSRFSSRRFTSDLRDAHARGLVGSAPHFNSVTNYMHSPAMTPVLRGLITASSLPLKAVETDFAVDSSGFSTSRFIRWFNKKYGRETDNREWVKLHLMCGVNTHVVTSAEVSGWAANDTTFFRPLLESTAEHFAIGDVSADKAYLSHANADAVERLGGTPLVPFKANTRVPTGDGAWERMWHLFSYSRPEFLARYHQRSNVETVFSMIKGKFGDSVMSKSDTGQMNEALCKVLAHNLCVMVQAIHELGIGASCYGEGVA
ncbi:MAG TPA: transposase [Acidimicrobiales bacterium]|nr:transposase [Acidimicrobiales bacterium]